MSSRSRPRAATSVATSVVTLPLRKRSSARSRANDTATTEIYTLSLTTLSDLGGRRIIKKLVELPHAMELLGARGVLVLARGPYGDRAAARLMGDELMSLWEPGRTAYVCGSARFAEAASRLLVDVGVPDHDIRVERFGPSGAWVRADEFRGPPRSEGA